jgi:hypothetical protein
VLLASVVTACAGEDGANSSDVTPTSTTTTEGIVVGPTCEEWLTRPVMADEVEEGCGAVMDGLVSYIQGGMAVIECDDGRMLFFNGNGWGYVGSPMQPPDAVALLSAQEACPLEMPPDPPAASS